MHLYLSVLCCCIRVNKCQAGGAKVVTVTVTQECLFSTQPECSAMPDGQGMHSKILSLQA